MWRIMEPKLKPTRFIAKAEWNMKEFGKSKNKLYPSEINH